MYLEHSTRGRCEQQEARIKSECFVVWCGLALWVAEVHYGVVPVIIIRLLACNSSRDSVGVYQPLGTNTQRVFSRDILAVARAKSVYWAA